MFLGRMVARKHEWPSGICLKPIIGVGVVGTIVSESGGPTAAALIGALDSAKLSTSCDTNLIVHFPLLPATLSPSDSSLLLRGPLCGPESVSGARCADQA